MIDDDGGLVVLVVVVVVVITAAAGIKVGFEIGRSAERGAQCAQSCSPRPGEMRDGKCFCLEARP